MKIREVNAYFDEVEFNYNGHTVKVLIKFEGVFSDFYKHFEGWFSVDNIGIKDFIFGADNGQECTGWLDVDDIIEWVCNYLMVENAEGLNWIDYYLEEYGD